MKRKFAQHSLTSFLLRFSLGVALVNLIAVNLVACTPGSNPSTGTVAAPVAEQKVAEQKVTMAGSSSSIGALKLLVKVYEAKNPTFKAVFQPNSQSSSNIAAVKNSLLDIGGSSHAPKPEEASDQIQAQEVAQDLLVVATHSGVTGVTNLTTAQLKGIYSGQITNWKELGGVDAEIVVLDRPEDESAKKLLRKYYLGGEKTTPKAVVLKYEDELIQTLQDTPYSIGTFSLAQAISNQLPVNRLSLDGVAATVENFAQGKYKMVRQIFFVYRKPPAAATQSLMDFIVSDEAHKILMDAGFVPIQSP